MFFLFFHTILNGQFTPDVLSEIITMLMNAVAKTEIIMIRYEIQKIILFAITLLLRLIFLIGNENTIWFNMPLVRY